MSRIDEFVDLIDAIHPDVLERDMLRFHAHFEGLDFPDDTEGLVRAIICTRVELMVLGRTADRLDPQLFEATERWLARQIAND